MHPLLIALIASTGSMLLLAFCLHQLKRLGSPGLAIREWLSAGFPLDVVVFLYTTAPLIGALVAPLIFDLRSPITWLLPIVAIAGQLIALYLWAWTHELANLSALRAAKGARLVSSQNRNLGGPITGRIRNHFSLLWTLLAVPVFNIVRLAEWIVYPVLVVVTKLPPYDSRQWVNVSRHKFEGLVGHDLIWCLYCDWMTGVWSLGTEMLRNIESFWCPIRFSNSSKCANCTLDFPDIDKGWVKENANVTDAARVIDTQYPAPDGTNAWLNHPVRLTVKGK
jgi:hypothetical protein